MGWDRKQSSARRLALPPDWYSRIRPRILRRDHYRCQWGSLDSDRFAYGLCPTRANQVDHKGRSDDHSDSNLRALCAYHHQIRTGRQGAAASHAARRDRARLRLRAPEPHPGGWT